MSRGIIDQALNLLADEETITQTTSPITMASGYVNENSVAMRKGNRTGSLVTLHARIRRSNSSNFANGRTTLGTINSNYLPATNVWLPISGSTTVNNVLNRTAFLLILPSGSVIVDTINSDIKQLQFTVSFMGGTT